jgi:hypothetical protein
MQTRGTSSRERIAAELGALLALNDSRSIST